MTGVALFLLGPSPPANSQTNEVSSAGLKPALETSEPAAEKWNWHVQNTDIVQDHPGFPASYSGPNSLSSAARSRKPCRWICMPARACGAGPRRTWTG